MSALWTEDGKPVPYPEEQETHHAWEWRATEGRREADRAAVRIPSSDVALLLHASTLLCKDAATLDRFGVPGSEYHGIGKALRDLAERANT